MTAVGDARKRSQDAAESPSAIPQRPASPQVDPDATATPVGAQGGDLDVAGIRARLEAATEGPWEAREGDLEGKPASEYVRTLLANREADGTSSGRLFLTLAPNRIDPEVSETVVPALTGDGPSAEANATFIAHARTDIPLLLTALDEAQAKARNHYAAFVGSEATLARAESARDAAEGALRDVRRRMEEIAVMWECEPHVERLDVHRQLCPGCHRADVIRAALDPAVPATEGGEGPDVCTCPPQFALSDGRHHTFCPLSTAKES